jgi:hypothetical protein
MSGLCSHCHKPSKKRCTECMEAPLYGDDDISATFYCNPECQKDGWHKHKQECQKLQTRITLHRAALLLQAIMFQIRRRACPFTFASAGGEEATIYLEKLRFHERDMRRMLGPFPTCFTDNNSRCEAVLVYMACLEATLFLHCFAKEFLGGINKLFPRIRLVPARMLI